METRKINDLALAAYLVVAGFKQSGRPTLAGSFLHFSFERTQKLDDAIEDFYTHKTSVDALAVIESYRTLRSWTTEAKKYRGGDRSATN
jgi:hypothetical protein